MVNTEIEVLSLSRDCHVSAVWPWASDLTSLNFGCCFCKAGQEWQSSWSLQFGEVFQTYCLASSKDILSAFVCLKSPPYYSFLLQMFSTLYLEPLNCTHKMVSFTLCIFDQINVQKVAQWAFDTVLPISLGMRIDFALLRANAQSWRQLGWLRYCVPAIHVRDPEVVPGFSIAQT